MHNENIYNIINNYLSSSETERMVEIYILNIVQQQTLENVICLSVEDNTMNGIDKEKNSWRIHFVNLNTERDFYIEILKTSSEEIESRCFYFDDRDNIVIIGS